MESLASFSDVQRYLRLNPIGEVDLSEIEGDIEALQDDVGDLQDLFVPATQYFPTLNAATPPNLGSDGTVTAYYTVVGQLVLVSVHVTFGGTGVDAGSGEYWMDLPIQPWPTIYTFANNLGGGSSLGSGHIRDATAGGNHKQITVSGRTQSGSLVRFGVEGATLNHATIPWAPNDVISWHAAYMRAP